jgi:dTDP-4-dehydrorhamnose reductase
MSGKRSFLVIGGDSLVGAELVRALERRGHVAFASTRRKDTVTARRVYLDFDSDAPMRLPPGIDYAFLVAAATNYDRCETDPAAWRTNVESIPRLAGSLLEQDAFVTFISTNSVFGGERPWPHEEDVQAPGIAYARHKAEGEKAIRAAARRLGAMDRLNIVRLTKILAPDTPPLPSWLSAWERGETVQPFSDLIFAPMSVRFAADALATIGEKRIPGDLHLSGAENVSYVDFANTLARSMGVDSRLISPTTAVKKGVSILFKPRYSGLGMRRTTALSGIAPQSLADVVNDLTATHSDKTRRRDQ